MATIFTMHWGIGPLYWYGGIVCQVCAISLHECTLMYDSNHSDALAGQKFASRAHLDGIGSVEGLFEWFVP